MKTNEPGTESQSPANAEIISEAVPVPYDAPVAYAPVAAPYARPTSHLNPVYGTPAQLAPVSYPLAPAAHLAPVAPLASTYGEPSAAIYSPAAAIYNPGSAVYDSAPQAYSPLPESYGPAPHYASSPVYEPISPNTYGGPSYEQLSDRAGQSTDSHSSYE